LVSRRTARTIRVVSQSGEKRTHGRARKPLREADFFLGLGGNLGDRRANLARARRLLEKSGLEILGRSSVYRTEPVGVMDQPWFLNQVVAVRTKLAPIEMLRLAKSVEAAMKRAPGQGNGPRIIDVDILLAGERVMESPELTIPHPRLALRNFVLVPLCEIAPEAVHPVLRLTAAELLRRSPDRSRVLKAGERRGGGKIRRRSRNAGSRPARLPVSGSR
jgi:2-amino-4-hydroxy-6-hydroxymethyldihydropteridine diphosphokinase